MTIKYLGSKRRLVPLLCGAVAACGAESALDLFSGTSRVARALKGAGLFVTAVDSASYAHVLAETYVATDARLVDTEELAAAVERLNSLPGRRGYVTEVFSEKARYFHPRNGARIDAVREAIEGCEPSHLRPLLLTSLLEAADRVDSTTGVQMAFLKEWAPRALKPLELRPPVLLPGGGRAVCGDAVSLVGGLGPFDVAYLDPPYNQHRYFTNYHVWETLVRWDRPEHYGVACKRSDCRDESTQSPFNRKGEMPAALAKVIAAVSARLLIVSYNNESWLSLDDIIDMCRARSAVAAVAVEQPRYVGARIGIHNPKGEKVGTVSHVKNRELLVVSGSLSDVEAARAAMMTAAAGCGLSAWPLVTA